MVSFGEEKLWNNVVVEKQLDCDLNKADYAGNKSMIEQSVPFHAFCNRQMQKGSVDDTVTSTFHFLSWEEE